MKIRVIHAIRESLWYADRLGEIFEVKDKIQGIYGGGLYSLLYDPRKIYVNDCKIVSEEALYPTLSESYFVEAEQSHDL